MRSSALDYVPSERLLSTLRTAAILGGLVFLVGLFVAPTRVWVGYLIGFNYLVGLGLSGGLFIAILYLSSAKWGTPLRRIPEAMTYSLPIAGCFGLVLLFGLHSLYEWSHAASVEHDPVLLAKSVYLNSWFFAARLIVFFVLWTWLTRRLVHRSRATDEHGDSGNYKRNVRTSALFMIVLTLSYSLASFDWLMSLEPHWYSTMFALYQLAGLALSGLGAATILLILLRRAGALGGYVTDDHIQTLGRCLLSLSIFWVYIWYGQYLLVWYTNIPEEVSWYAARRGESWSILTPTLLVLNWIIPFVTLLRRDMCRSESVLLRISVVVMLGRAVDLYLGVGPPVLGDQPTFGVWEAGPIVGALAVFFYFTLIGVAEARTVPYRDPALENPELVH